MRVHKSLISVAAAATLVLVQVACSGGGDGGGGGVPTDVTGAYTLVYQRVQSNSNCVFPANDPTWVFGILQIAQDGDTLTFDFGQGYVVQGSREGDDWTFSGALTDSAGLVSVTGLGVFTTSSGAPYLDSDDVDGIVADYDNECRVRGMYSGVRLQ